MPPSTARAHSSARPRPPRRSKTIVAKRGLLAIHRWLGVALWLIFCSWFTSGIIMMYAGYPELTSARRLALLPPLELTRCCVSLDSAVAAAKLAPPLRQARLEMLVDRPVYRLQDVAGDRAVVYADDGTPLVDVTVRIAALVAARATRLPVDTMLAAVLPEPDQWVLEEARSQFPLARFALRDPAATRAYVSLVTGEIVQVVDRRQRALAWVGAIPHWIYPSALRRHRDGWRYLVLALATLGIIGCLTGLTMGVWRARLRGRGAFVRSPFLDPWRRWHHYLGLVFGLCAFTWVSSGLLSLNPFDWSPGGSPSAADVTALAGGHIEPKMVSRSPREAWRRVAPTITARRLELRRIGGKTFYVAAESPTVTRLLDADAAQASPRDRLARTELLAAFRPVARGARIAAVEELTGYDDYYYSRTGDRPLPVVRVVIDDPDATSYYLDERDGTIAFMSTRRSRVERWLYHGLHSLDFSALIRHPPIWDLLVIVLSLGGLALSVTGAVLGVRWLRAPS